ncbi:DNA cytosine methyltransferase [Lonsdalea quercina]|uniref:DNA cytosine methyltransferase n=1 Tax=Lonsdalea quercina TaxID=71657 RepID=UPI003974DF36
MAAYYNEIDPFAAQWLRNLIRAGHIAPGDVDERSIEDVTKNDIRNYTQCHFFAGIGVWSYALRQAGWNDDLPVWTGSCPCQPFSSAGNGDGFDDPRHLWPAFQRLIAECRPSVVFGEQVASKAVDPWIDLVQDDLEAVGYAFGAVAFPSAGVGAPHIRDRTYWVANTYGECGDRVRDSRPARGHEYPNGGILNRLDNANYPRLERYSRDGGAEGREGALRSTTATSTLSRPLQVNGFWREADWIGCRDGKWRPVEPGTFPLAARSSNRVGRLRAYGNAINAEAAKAFIVAFMESHP